MSGKSKSTNSSANSGASSNSGLGSNSGSEGSEQKTSSLIEMLRSASAADLAELRALFSQPSTNSLSSSSRSMGGISQPSEPVPSFTAAMQRQKLLSTLKLEASGHTSLMLKSSDPLDVLNHRSEVERYLHGMGLLAFIRSTDFAGKPIAVDENHAFFGLETEVRSQIYTFILDLWPETVRMNYNVSSNNHDPKLLWEQLHLGSVVISNSAVTEGETKMKSLIYEQGVSPLAHIAHLEQHFSAHQQMVQRYNSGKPASQWKSFTDIDKISALCNSLRGIKALDASFRTLATELDRAVSYVAAKTLFINHVQTNFRDWNGQPSSSSTSVPAKFAYPSGRRNRSNKNLRPVVCHNCGRRGHSNQNCNKDPVECFTCGRKGHMKKFCRSKDKKNVNLKEKSAKKKEKNDDPKPSSSDASHRDKVPSGEKANDGENQNEGGQPAPSFRVIALRTKSPSKKLGDFDVDALEDFSLFWDSCCGQHAVRNPNLLENIREVSEPQVFEVANGQRTQSNQKGRIRLTNLRSAVSDVGADTLIIDDVWLCPDFSANLLSPGVLARRGFQTQALPTGFRLVDPQGRPSLLFQLRDDNIFGTNVASFVPFRAPTRAFPVFNDSRLLRLYRTLHEKYGHAGIGKLIEGVQSGVVHGMTTQQLQRVQSLDHTCISCELCKIKSSPVNSESKREEPTHPLSVICADVLSLGFLDFSEFKPEFIRLFNPPKYISGIYSDFASYLAIRQIQSKDVAPDHVIEFYKKYSDAIEVQANLKLPAVSSTLVVDNAYDVKRLNEFCKNVGVHISYTPPHVHHNNYIEQSWRPMLAGTRAAMLQAGAPLFLVGFFLEAVNFALNQLTPAGQSQSKFTLFHGHPIRDNVLHVIGSDCSVMFVGDEKRQFGIGKTGPKAYLGLFLGLDLENLNFDAFKIYDIDRHRIVTRRDVRILEGHFTVMEKLNKISRKVEAAPTPLPSLPPSSLSSPPFSSSPSSPNLPEPSLRNSSYESHDWLQDLEFEALKEKGEKFEKESEEKGREQVRREEQMKELIRAQEDADLLIQLNKLEKNSRSQRYLNRSSSRPANSPTSPPPAQSEKVQNEDENSQFSLSSSTSLKSGTSSSKLQSDEEKIMAESEVGRPSDGRRYWLRRSHRVLVAQALKAINRRQYVSYAEAMASPERSEWEKAIEKEASAHSLFGTFEMVEVSSLPESAEVLELLLLLSRKYDANGNLTRYKARIVLRGDQQNDCDFDETSSPVLGKIGLKLILALAVQFSLQLKKGDVLNAYLHAKMDKDIYCQIPPGFPGYEQRGRMVYKVNQALYGAKQAGFLFNSLLDAFLRSQNFSRAREDSCVYFRQSQSGRLIVLGVYVDDNIIAYHPEDENEFEKFMQNFKSKFRVEDFVPADSILGIKIDYDVEKGRLELSQTAFVEKMLRRFNMKGCNVETVPASDSQRNVSGAIDSSGFAVRDAVGCLIYLATLTRPDILYSVNVVARQVNQASEVTVKRIKRIFRYLRGTMNLGLVYHRIPSSNFVLSVFTDAGFDNNEGSRSQTGYAVYLGACNLYSTSHVQDVIAKSPAEAEIMAIDGGASEAISVMELVKEVLRGGAGATGQPIAIFSSFSNISFTVFTDSTAAIHALSDWRSSIGHRMKHVTRRLNWLLDAAKRNQIQFRHLRTDKQVADIFTKPLEKAKFIPFRDMILGRKEIKF